MNNIVHAYALSVFTLQLAMEMAASILRAKGKDGINDSQT